MGEFGGLRMMDNMLTGRGESIGEKREKNIIERSNTIANKSNAYEKLRLIESDMKENKQPIKIAGYVEIDIYRTDSTYNRFFKFINEEKKRLLREIEDLLVSDKEKCL